MPKSSEHGDYIDFIGIDKILYSYIPLNLIFKELWVDEFMISNAFMGKFLSQYLDKIWGRIFSILERIMQDALMNKHAHSWKNMKNYGSGSFVISENFGVSDFGEFRAQFH